MPILKCPNNCGGRLHPTKRPTESWEDTNGYRHPRFYHYECDGCGRAWTRDALRNVWS